MEYITRTTNPTYIMSSGTNLNNDYFPVDTLTSSNASDSFSLNIKGTLSTTSFLSKSTTNFLSKDYIIRPPSTGISYLYNELNYLDRVKNNLYKLESTTPTFNITDEHHYDSGFNYTTEQTTEGTVSFISGTAGLYIDNGGDVSLNPIGPDFLESPRLIKRRNIKKNLAIHFKSRANPIRSVPENEQVAIETLREEITESEFRKYMKYGFVLVEGQSGKTYQIFRNQSHTKVWKNGRVIEEICVRIKNYKIPPTDNVIAFSNMIQIDEEEFRKLGNIYKMQKAA